MSVSCELSSNVYRFESEYYRVSFDATDNKFGGAMEFYVKQGENVNKVLFTPAHLRPFSLVFERTDLACFGPTHIYSIDEPGSVRAVLSSTGQKIRPFSITSSLYDDFLADERITGYADRFVIQHVWRNTSETPVVVYSNMHMWHYSNRFYSQETMVKDFDRRSVYDSGTYDCAICLHSWNDFELPHVLNDNSSSGWLAHWYRDEDYPAPTSADGDFVQTIIVFVQPPGSSESSDDILGKIDDYLTPDTPSVSRGSLNTGSHGDFDADGFNEGEAAYHFNCDSNNTEFTMDTNRGGTSLAFYYPVFVLHDYYKDTAPVLRLDGSFLDGENGRPHEEAQHLGNSYSSAVLGGGLALVWCNAIFSADTHVQIAGEFRRRKLLHTGANLRT